MDCIENDSPNNSSIALCVLVAVVMFLPNSSPAAIRGYAYRQRLMGEFMKYVVETGSGAIIYIPSFIKIGAGIQKLIKGGAQTYRQHDDCKSPLLFIFSK
jgi:hypothetical protein